MDRRTVAANHAAKMPIAYRLLRSRVKRFLESRSFGTGRKTVSREHGDALFKEITVGINSQRVDWFRKVVVIFERFVLFHGTNHQKIAIDP